MDCDNWAMGWRREKMPSKSIGERVGAHKVKMCVRDQVEKGRLTMLLHTGALLRAVFEQNVNKRNDEVYQSLFSTPQMRRRGFYETNIPTGQGACMFLCGVWCVGCVG